TARFTVKNFRTDSSLSFANDITPILIKAGCNGSACHGAANGQGGFKLSFFGYDADKDREAAWTANNGRRVNQKDPASSMLLLKPGGVIPHSGGKRFAKDGPEYRTIHAWIRAGGPLNPVSQASFAKTVALPGPKLASLTSDTAKKAPIS